jgi:hypothetical protein
VASESTHPPPPPSGGNLKYAVVGLVLIAGAAAVWFGMQSCEETPENPVANAQVDAGTRPQGRDTALVDEDLVIPDPVPDAGPRIDGGPRIRYVTRFVGGGGGGGNWSCSGDINRQRAAAVLAENRLQFRNCYERRLKANNTLEGTVNVSMRVSRTGAVDAVSVGGTLRDGETLSCVRRIAQRIRFPAPTGGACAVVSAPFNFSRQE